MAWPPEPSPLLTLPPHGPTSGVGCRLGMLPLPVCSEEGSPRGNFTALESLESRPAIAPFPLPWPEKWQLPKGHVSTVLRMDTGWAEATVASPGKPGTSLSLLPFAALAHALQIFGNFPFLFSGHVF